MSRGGEGRRATGGRASATGAHGALGPAGRARHHDRGEDPLAKMATHVAARTRPSRKVVGIVREPLDVASSWALERLQIVLDDGSSVERLLKHLDREAPGSQARATKPAEVLEPERERWVYRHLLSRLDVGAPRCGDAPEEISPPARWLLLELVEGTRLSETSVGRPWEGAARRLARLHAGAPPIVRNALALSGSTDRSRPGEPPGHRWAPLLDHGPALRRRWMARAVEFSARGDRRRHTLIESLGPAHGRAIEITRTGPSGFIHGEFYPSNILVERGTDAIRPVDWEMAGWGPLLLDLAALTSGLGEGDRSLLTDAYRDEARSAGLDLPRGRDFARLLFACRLLLAVQWLGWSRTWNPPPEHRFDWTQEALRCARDLMR